MPIREKKNERLAGLFVLIGLLMLGGLILQFGRFGDRFSDNYELSVEFSDTAGIIKGSEVRFRGAEIGKVSTKPELVIRENKSAVLMKLNIRDDMNIPSLAKFQISSAGLTGDKFIEVVPPEEENGKFYEPGQTIIGDSSGSFDAIKDNAESITRETRDLLRDVKVTVTKLNVGLDSIKNVSDTLDVTINRVNENFLSEQNATSFSLMVENFGESSRNINQASEQLQPLIAEFKPILDEARLTLANIQSSTERALINVPSAVESIDRAASKAEQTMTTLQSKSSVAGVLTQDEKAGEDAKDFMKNLKRYGILRYRDDESPETYDPRNKFRGTRR